MPPEGDSPLARFAHAIARGKGFVLGPARLSDDGSTVRVPILRLQPPPRRYAVAAEASEGLSAVDFGRIDRLRVRNDSETPVLIPAGSLFEGHETTSRGTTAGVWLAPSAERVIEVRCVQPSRPVSARDVLSLVPRLAPPDLTQALLSCDQGLVWTTAPTFRSDEPADAASRQASLGPICGEVLLDAQGVLMAEVYDHPDSWSAAGPRPLSPSAPTALGLDPANAAAVVRGFLERMASSPSHPSGPSAVSNDASCAFEVLGGAVVHLVAFGRDLTRSPTADAVAAAGPRSSLEVSEVAAMAFAPGSAGEADVAVAARSSVESPVPAPVAAAASPSPRRKVLTTGWDPATFASLERFSHKEFGGDRSAAIRALVRRGLGEGGYLGPRSPPPMSALPGSETDESESLSEPAQETLNARIREYERIAATETYADWLRKRARREVERLTGAALEPPTDEAPTVLEPSPAPETVEEAPEPEEIVPEAPRLPPPPPVDVRPLLRRAFAASAGGHYPEALTLFDDVLTAEPDNRTALLGRAVALRRSGKAQEALDALDAVLRAEPTNAAALLNRGRLLQERGDLNSALEAFDLLSTVAPNDWDVWLVRGDVLAKLGRRSDALRAYSEAQRRNPDDQSLKLRIRTLENMESAPTLPPTPRIPLPRDVQEGQSYLVQETRPSLSLRVLRALAARGVPSLAITTRRPDAVRRDVGITGIRILELSHTPGEGRHDPTALAALGHLVSRFVQEGRGHGVVALDGLASLVLENGAREVLLFLERVHEAVLQSHAVFLVSIAPGDLSERELALLERSLRTLS